MPRCDLDLWPHDLERLQNFGCHVYKLYTKFERNRIIHGWVIDDLARFRRAILGGCGTLPSGSQGCVNPTSPNLARTWGDHSYMKDLFQSSDILLHFQIQCIYWLLICLLLLCVETVYYSRLSVSFFVWFYAFISFDSLCVNEWMNEWIIAEVRRVQVIYTANHKNVTLYFWL